VELQDSANWPEHVWTLFVDRSSDKRGGGVGIVIEGPDGFSVDHSLLFKFKASNNQALQLQPWSSGAPPSANHQLLSVD